LPPSTHVRPPTLPVPLAYRSWRSRLHGLRLSFLSSCQFLVFITKKKEIKTKLGPSHASAWTPLPFPSEVPSSSVSASDVAASEEPEGAGVNVRALMLPSVSPTRKRAIVIWRPVAFPRLRRSRDRKLFWTPRRSQSRRHATLIGNEFEGSRLDLTSTVTVQYTCPELCLWITYNSGTLAD
jgi:hypothetical protein